MAREMTAHVLSLVLMICTVFVVSSFAASMPEVVKLCPEGTFFDHGTVMCEPCLVICQDADITGLVDKCQRLCPKTYAQLSNKQEKPELAALQDANPKDKSPSSSASTSGQSIMLLAGIIGGIVVVSFLVVLGAFVCKRMQENQPGANNTGPSTISSATLRGSNPSRQGYRPAGVQEESGNHGGGRVSQQGPRGYCDPRHWFSANVEVPTEETEAGRQGTQEIALLGNSQGSVIQDLSVPKTVIATPIYKPSGSMRSTRI
ncbi:uncharacterized protein LOC143296551 [Babylonia areolata]|uniref:uncharacterized protein LOC143296551 n=1 Tax=Babylonia areolata TaxID=304850 RepID=UPI003FD36B3C